MAIAALEPNSDSMSDGTSNASGDAPKTWRASSGSKTATPRPIMEWNPTTSPYFAWIERMYSRGAVTNRYVCQSAGVRGPGGMGIIARCYGPSTPPASNGAAGAGGRARGGLVHNLQATIRIRPRREKESRDAAGHENRHGSRSGRHRGDRVVGATSVSGSAGDR